MSVRWLERKEARNKMTINTSSTPFHHFMAKICILLFFLVFASKFRQSLITDNAAITNQMQREFLFNNCIQSQEFFSRLSQHPKKTNFFKRTLIQMALYRHLTTTHPPKLTNLFKQRRAVTSRRRQRPASDGAFFLSRNREKTLMERGMNFWEWDS
jgi:hypothetical protein